jgi:hypothetical protein
VSATSPAPMRKEPCPCGCGSFILAPYFNCQCSSLREPLATAVADTFNLGVECAAMERRMREMAGE